MKNSEGQAERRQDLHKDGRAGLELAINLFDNTKEGSENVELSAYVSFWIKHFTTEALIAGEISEQFAAEFEQECGRRPNSEEFLGFIKMKMDQILKASSTYFQRTYDSESKTGSLNIDYPKLNQRDDYVPSIVSAEPTPTARQKEQLSQNRDDSEDQTVERPISVSQSDKYLAPLEDGESSAAEADRPPISNLELSKYLSPRYESVLSLRYPADSQEGLRTYNEIAELLNKSGSVYVANICRESLEILDVHHLTADSLITAETLDAIRHLSRMQHEVVVSLFGLEGHPSATYKLVAKRLNIETRKVREIEYQAIHCLRQMLQTGETDAYAERQLYIERDLIRSLDFQSQQVIILRYGLDGLGVRTRQATGQELNITTIQVGDIIDLSLKVLRQEKGMAADDLLVYPHLLKSLKGLDRQVIEKSLGFADGHAWNYKDIAEALGITAVQAREREKRVIKNLYRTPYALQPDTPIGVIEIKPPIRREELENQPIDKFELYKQSQAKEWLFITTSYPRLAVLIEDRIRRHLLDVVNMGAFHLIPKSTLSELEFCLLERALPKPDRTLLQGETELSEKVWEMSTARAEGKRLGRTSRLSEEAKLIILESFNAGFSLASIARFLNDSKIATPTGGKIWYNSSIKAAIKTIRLDLESDLRREVVASIRAWQNEFGNEWLLDDGAGILWECFNQNQEIFKQSVLAGKIGRRLAGELFEDFEITDKTTYADLWTEASTTMLLMAERCLGDLFNSFKATFDRPPTAKEIEKYIALSSLVQHKQLAVCLSDFPAPEATE